MNKANPLVDNYIKKATMWKDEIEKLRMILLESELQEELKWGTPCYTYNNTNVILLYVFKAYMGIGFIKGALLSDTSGILMKQGENTRAVRLIKFSNVKQIEELEPVLKNYINEAIVLEKAGLKVDFTSQSELIYPEEFQEKLVEIPALKAAFEKLTQGRKRAYNLYFSAPKQAITRQTRVDKCISRILEGKGLTD